MCAYRLSVYSYSIEKFLHRIVLHIIFKCIDIIYLLRRWYRILYTLILHYLSLLSSFFKHKIKKDNSDKLSLTKLPSHLGIIVCEDCISFSDISSLIIWCFCFGIHHISIYDSKGFVKSNGVELYKVMNHKKDILLKKRACFFNVIFRDGKSPFSFNISTKNGHITDDIHVYLLSPEDGKQRVIEATRNVCKMAKLESKFLENFQAAHMRHFFKTVIDIPDPDLVLLFGQTKGLMGYLPWHIRLTEIISQLTHHGFSFEEFKNVLQRYSRCEQRFGK